MFIRVKAFSLISILFILFVAQAIGPSRYVFAASPHQITTETSPLSFDRESSSKVGVAEVRGPESIRCDAVLEAVELETVESPIPAEILEQYERTGVALSDVIQDIYDVHYDPSKVFTPEQFEKFQKSEKHEELLNKGLVIITAPAWAPPLLVAAVTTWVGRAIRSGGRQLGFKDVFFLQERIGRGGKPFRIYKLRTMRDDIAGPTHTLEKDPRITAEGLLFRKTKIDELPQMLNILFGDMSIVGPRPLVSREVAEALEFDPRYGYRFLKKPGLTSLGQILCDHCSTAPQNLKKFRHELYGILNNDIKSVFKTILRTPIAIIKGKGAR